MSGRFSPSNPCRPLRGVAAAWGLVAVLTGASAQAQDGAAQLSQIGQRFVDAALHQPAADAPQTTNGSPLRMEVQMGQLDSRLRLAACARVEPYLPAGSRLWGRTRLGLRCLRLSADAERALLVQISERPGALRLVSKVLKLAVMYSGGEPLNEQVLRVAFNELEGE